ncbi:alpha/beta fold hydrolase [Flavobacterium sp. NG2]|uniref:alpha/beta fold hydrolase n=1 Tax=Flavobacterium sp. NG2 TaxID=3097547 RepID=UPI002A82F865|nr:alpha/beta fold hydrolase [Flavobacterium sp. NG2]WPR72948.1 alpha/beta fold hydrolase [Flavobacterium sp. NG2]
MTKVLYYLFTKSVGLYLNFLSFAFPEKASQMAYSLFSEPRRGKLKKDKLPKTLAKANTKTFQYEGQEFVTYTWEGNENVILLVHGWESNASRWKKLLPYLQKSGSTIIALDAPGHGLSSGREFHVPKYADFIDVVVQKFKPKHLIGHSWGGKTCLYYQAHYTNSTIEKMVILGSPSDFKIILNNYITLLSLNSSITKALEIKYTSVFQKELEEFTGKHFASQIKTKGLIAHDTDDTVVLFDEGKKIANAWEDAIFIETSGLGHAMHDGELYEKIYSFLFED